MVAPRQPVNTEPDINHFSLFGFHSEELEAFGTPDQLAFLGVGVKFDFGTRSEAAPPDAIVALDSVRVGFS